MVMGAHFGLSFCVLSIINTINANKNSVLCKTLLEDPSLGITERCFLKNQMNAPLSINSFFLPYLGSCSLSW